MIEVDTIELEGKEYIIVEEITINGVVYMHLANSSDPEDFCIRKVIVEDNEEIITGLDNREEFDKVLSIFAEKHHKDLEI